MIKFFATHSNEVIALISMSSIALSILISRKLKQNEYKERDWY